MASWRLGFTPPMEAAFQRSLASGSGALDTCVSLHTLLFKAVLARQLWAGFHGAGTRPPLGGADALLLAVFLAWAPLVLSLALCRPHAYLRLRTPLVLLARVQRLLTVLRFAALFDEAAGGHAAIEQAAAEPAAALGLLLWRPSTVAALLCTYLIPLKYNLPVAALALPTMLHTALRHCAAECRGPGGLAAARLYAEAQQLLRRWLPLWLGPGPAVAASCGNSGCGTDACMRSCAAVHGWLLIVVGTLLPLLVCWALEEAARYRFQRRWLQLHAPDDSAGLAAAARLVRPLPAVTLAGWLAACAWALRLLLDATLKPPTP